MRPGGTAQAASAQATHGSPGRMNARSACPPPAPTERGDGERSRYTASFAAAAWLLPFGLLCFAVIAVPMLILDEQGLPRYEELRDELRETRAENHELRRGVRSLQREVSTLRTDTEAVERIARDELGMVRQDELIFQFDR